MGAILRNNEEIRKEPRGASRSTMSQRNPMNERYQSEEHTGVSRKSAASAKPKAKAAASVIVQSSEKSPQQKKAERKEEKRRLASSARSYAPSRHSSVEGCSPIGFRWSRCFWLTPLSSWPSTSTSRRSAGNAALIRSA